MNSHRIDYQSALHTESLRWTFHAFPRRPLRKSVEQTPCARGSAARAVPLTQGDNVLFELFSPSERGRAARSAAGGLFNHSNDSYAKLSFSRRGDRAI